MIEGVAGAIVTNLRKNDPEWRFQAGALADLIATGSKLSPRAKEILKRHIPSTRDAFSQTEWVRILRLEEHKLS